MKYVATIGEQSFEIDINEAGEITANGEVLAVDFQSVTDQPVYSMLLNGESFEANVYTGQDQVEVLLRGQLYLVNVEDERQRRLRESSGGGQILEGEFNLVAPMPGLVVGVPVQIGDEVELGQNLVILESMKMQNELKAPRAGTVTGLRVSAGDSVDQNQIMVTLS
jgi:biotin carboxyl carrier protein